ncbi:hypothetical protein BDN67DRAFT_971567 [Paxillus ammoniavirescens]|nr:hypothetical protein BDN67DRAFT_971567 [Paxillus ammoniavirescens]
MNVDNLIVECLCRTFYTPRKLALGARDQRLLEAASEETDATRKQLKMPQRLVISITHKLGALSRQATNNNKLFDALVEGVKEHDGVKDS